MFNPFTEPITMLGETVGRSPGKPFGIYQPDRLLHLFILGQTGAGKSTLILNMVMQDIVHQKGFCLLDPHGDIALTLKNKLPPQAIYWDVADAQCPYGYNPLSYVQEAYRPLVASGIIDAFKNQWRDAWGVRMEHLLRFGILALLSRPHSSLCDIIPLFTDKAFRSKVLQQVTDTEVLKFWHKEYPRMNYKNAFDGVAPIANKLGAFLSHPVVRTSLTCPRQPLRFRTLMDEGIPIVINLSKGRLGSDIASLVAGVVVSMITQASYTRISQAPHQRRSFMVYLDEFHTVTTHTMTTMLSELRKFKVGLILSGQYTSQVSETMCEAILGNVGTQVIFRIGAKDASLIGRQLDTNPSYFINLPNYHMFVKLMVKGKQTKVFSGRTTLLS